MAIFVILTANFVLIIGICQGENLSNVIYITVTVNDSLMLPCNVSDVTRSIWLVDKTNNPQTLTSGNTAFRPNRHSLNITTDGVFFTYNLVIFSVKEFEGERFTCKENGILRSAVIIFIEVPPSVWLEFNNSKLGDTLDVIMNREYRIRCWAEGGRPPVTLSWEVDNYTVTEGTLQLQDGGNTVSSVINYRPELHDARLTCKTGGQRIVPRIQSHVLLHILYKPVCSLHSQNADQRPNNFLIQCVCTANPDVSDIFISVNNSTYMAESQTVLKTNNFTMVFCKAQNTVGFSEIAVTTIHPARVPVEKEDLPADFPQEGRKRIETAVIAVSIVLSILVFSLLIAVFAVFMSHRSRLNTERQISSTYEAIDDAENRRVTVSRRIRMPSPVDQQRLSLKEGNDYIKRNLRTRMSDQQGLQGARNTQSIYSVSIDVEPRLTMEVLPPR